MKRPIPPLPLALAALLILAAAAALGGAAWLGLWPVNSLPNPADLSKTFQPPSVRITDRNGQLLYDVLPGEGGRHTVVALSEIAPALRQATIATEDAQFYTNPGVDLGGILRSVWINLSGGETIAGGSTITQQVARNLLLSSGERAERSLRRKLREGLLAVQLTRRLSKDEILATYLNQMYYGNLAYGVEAASQTYFGKPAAQLDLAEAALLAGLPQSPAQYDPFSAPEAAKARQRVVLGLMEKTGVISAEQRALAEAEPLSYNPQPYPIHAPHFVMMVRAQLDALISTDEIYRRGGVTVRTTLDLNWQEQAEAAVQRQLARLKEAGQRGMDYNVRDAALTALDPRSGQILALVGSADYFNAAISGAVNMATAPRQPGSALKPLIYAAAFDPTQPDPMTPASMLLDVSTHFTTHDGKAYTPANYDLREHGPVLARQALASSLNIPAVLTLQHVGLKRLFNFAGSLGITTLGDPDRYDLSLALGGGEVTLLQLTAAYGALANGGLRVSPTAILELRDPQGNVLYTAPTPEAKRVIDPRVAWLVSDILSDDDARTLGFGRNSVLRLDRPAAVKTGTTTNFHDNWTVGYTPSLVVGVWAGNADQTAMRGINGLTGAAPIWHEFMRTALAGQSEQTFTRPSGLVRQEVCALSGRLPTADCPYRRSEWFIDGTQPTQADTLYRAVTLDRVSGLLAQADTPTERRVQRLALDLPPQAAAWARANALLLYSDLLAGVPANGAAASGNSSASALPPDDPAKPDPSAGPTAPTTSVVSPAAPGVQFLSPADHSVYRLDPHLDREMQRLMIQVAGDPAAGALTLWVDGAVVQTFSAPPYRCAWPLAVGTHTLRAVQGSQQTEIQITVK
jgi:penicillin-binding protein 1C